MPDTDNEPESAAGGQLPLTRAKWATAAQVVAIAAGVLALASGLLMWRIVGYTAANLETRVSFLPTSITNWSVLLSVAPAGAGALVAVVALALKGRARWLRYLQIGLWLLALASSAYIADTCAPFTGLGPLYGPLVVGDVAGVVTVVLLTLSLRRPAGRQQRWHLAFVLLAAGVPCIAIAAGGGSTYPTHGPGSGILTGIVARCPSAMEKASGGGPDLSRVVTVSVQNRAGQTVASQRLPLRTSGARYRMRLPTGTYSINAATVLASAGDTVYVPADKTNEEDFNDPDSWSCVG